MKKSFLLRIWTSCFSFLVSTVFAQNQWIHQSPIPKGDKNQPISTSLTVTAQFPQIFRNQKRPLGTCNLPPIPAPGETVTWTLANSPYDICQNITIPLTSTVIVEAGVHVNYDPVTGAFIETLMRADGTPLQIDGLWALLPLGNGVFFTAGIADEEHGLFGLITED
jgi:hypothetical protein